MAETNNSITSGTTVADGVTETSAKLPQLNDHEDEKEPRNDGDKDFKPGLDFWIIIAVMCTASFASALDTTIITTALPKVSNSIGGDAQYVWIANSFVFTSTVFQPLFGQLSNIFGRRNPMLVAMSLFVLGAGIGGGASSVAMLIAGRTVQGLGSAGMFVLTDIIVSDITPLRERGKYMAIILSTAAIGTVAGPIIGGALAESNWRWCFYINLPLGIPPLILMVFFLKLKYKRGSSLSSSLARVDYVGNLILIPSALALILGLVLGGSAFPWSSWRIILPIVLGGVGLIGFQLYEMSPFCKEPSIAPHIFRNRTTCTALILGFLAGMMLNWTSYFVAFYFQATKGAIPVTSGVDLLPMFLFILPASMLAGGILSKTGQYKPLHWLGFAFTALGVGLFSILDNNSSPAEWVFFQIFAAIGLGFAVTTLLPAVLAGLEESDVATATSAFSFMRAMGFVWGITIPSIIFNNQFDAHSYQISNPTLRGELSGGAAYGFAQSGRISNLSLADRQEVVQTYVIALREVWYVAIAFPLIGFLMVFAEKHIALRTSLNTEFGIDERNKDDEQNLESKAENGGVVHEN